MGKRISWAEPLITLEVPNSWPAIRQVSIPKDGLRYGNKSINYGFGLQEGGNSLNTPFILRKESNLSRIRGRKWCRYAFIIIVIAIISSKLSYHLKSLKVT